MIAGISSARTTKVSRRTPIATVAPIWISSSSGSRVRVAKVPARISPAPVTTPPVATSARSVPSRVPWTRRLLAHPGHQEDVVVDAERDQEDEGEQGEVEGDPFAAELGEGEGREAEACRRRRGRRSRSGRAAPRSPAAPPPGSARRRAGPAARSAGCRGRWSARRPSSPPAGRRAGRRGEIACRRSRICFDLFGRFARVRVAVEDQDHQPPIRTRSSAGTGIASRTESRSASPRSPSPLRRPGRPRSAARRGRAGSVRSAPRCLRSSWSAWSRPGRSRSCRGGRGCRAARTRRPAMTSSDDRPRAAARPAPRSPPSGSAPRAAPPPRAGQKARSPSTASRAGRRVKAEQTITAMPIARIGPSQWVDCRSATSRTSIAAITVPPEAAIGRDALAQGQRQRLLGRAAAPAAPRDSGGRAAASSRSRRRTRAPRGGRCPRC